MYFTRGISIFFSVTISLFHISDKVEFGEVVHAPPMLSVRPKKISNDQGVDKVRKKHVPVLEVKHLNIKVDK